MSIFGSADVYVITWNNSNMKEIFLWRGDYENRITVLSAAGYTEGKDYTVNKH